MLSSVLIELLEPRALLAAVEPTALEVYLVTLINRARMSPATVAKSFGIDINEGLAAGTLSTAPVQPVAINGYLTSAARGHSQYMLKVDKFAHDGIGDSTPSGRVTNTGYQIQGGVCENIGWQGSHPLWPEAQPTATLMNRSLFVDTTVPGRLHRLVMLDPGLVEVGVGCVSGQFTDSEATWNTYMLTEDFATNPDNHFITGVVYLDTVRRNSMYDPGEGVGSALIQAERLSDGKVFSIRTGTAGAYSLQVPDGTYRVTMSGGGLPTSTVRDNVVVAGLNVLSDFRFAPSLKPTLASGVLRIDGTAKNDLICVDRVGTQIVVKVNSSKWSFAASLVKSANIWGWQGNDTIYGSQMSDTIYGMWGNDVLYGRGGADSMSGAAGNDKLDGGTGNDSLDGGSGTDVLLGGTGNDTLRGGSGRDTLSGGLGDDWGEFDPLDIRSSIQHKLLA